MKHELQKVPILRLQGDFYPFGAFFIFVFKEQKGG
jgi:hypothetical protein